MAIGRGVFGRGNPSRAATDIASYNARPLMLQFCPVVLLGQLLRHG